MQSSANIWSPLAEGQAVLPYSPGQLIYLQDTEAQVFYYIVSGTVRCFLSAPTGEERTLTLHHAGDLIGEAAFFDKQPRVSSAVAVTPCTLVSIDRPHLEEVFSRRPDLAVSMLEYLARTVRLLSAHVDSAFLQADRRLARYLLTLIPDENGILSCTHEELGAAVGLSRVTVSRTLSKFAKDGLIRTGYRSLVILDRKALDLLSQ
ncbi:MAG TPA: Crp/Fnr family transcriptional regulator [Candidatus Flavonifractor merdipullorum]|uniref:Crp/Fnr family transcriptional regulator n=1 Tax=Candidatus Flavonifractor merdipullorum TaxID=2838590 RepID=A0A9D1UNF8_9FIRM|nr:Crp/Fnr family transcriptional regulator [Candidatus Flavonifractor merdipullorum]